MDLVETIAQAIARFEGFFQPGSLASRNNNPGNLRTWGSLPTSGGYVVFPTAEAGWAALRRQVSLNISRGLNLSEFFGGKPGVYPGYAPAADGNQPAIYAGWVGSQTGLPLDVPLTQVAAGPAAVSSGLPLAWLQVPESEIWSGGLVAAGLLLAAALVLFVMD